MFVHCPQLHIAKPWPPLVHLSVPIALPPQAPRFSVEIVPVGADAEVVGEALPEALVLVGSTEKVIVVEGAVAVAMTNVVEVEELAVETGVKVELPDTV